MTDESFAYKKYIKIINCRSDSQYSTGIEGTVQEWFIHSTLYFV